MKENSRDTNNATLDQKLSTESKVNILDIKPKKYGVILPNSDNKLYHDKITIKNLLDFPIILNVRSSDTKKLELKDKVIKLNPQQVQVLEFTLFIEPSNNKNSKKSNSIKSSKCINQLYIYMKSDLVDLKYFINVERTNEAKKQLVPTKLNITYNNNSTLNEEKTENKTDLSEYEFNFNNRVYPKPLRLDEKSLEISNNKKDNSKPEKDEYSKNDFDNNNTFSNNYDNPKNEIISLPSNRRDFLQESYLTKIKASAENTFNEKSRQPWSTLVVDENTDLLNHIDKSKEDLGTNEIEGKGDYYDNEAERDVVNVNNLNFKDIQLGNNEYYKKSNFVSNQVRELNELLNENYLLKEENIILNNQNDEIKNENLVLKERMEKLIQRLNEMGLIIEEYQFLLTKKGSFSGLLISNLHEFSIISVNSNEVLLKKDSEKRLKFSYLLENFMQSRNPDDIQIIDSISNSYFNSIKNNNEPQLQLNKHKSNTFISTSLEGGYRKKNLFNISNQHEIVNEININIVSNYDNYVGQTITDNYEGRIENNNEEQNNNYNYNSSSPDNQYCQIVNLNTYNENSLINSIKDRFIELEYHNFTENRRRLEAIQKIFDTIYSSIFIKKNSEQENINNNTTNYPQLDLLTQSAFSENMNFANTLKKLEELIRMFLGRLSYYKDINEEFIAQKAIEKLSVVRKEEALFYSNDIENLYNDIQNIVLMENELENYKLDNKKLLIEYTNISENFDNLSKDLEEYKIRIKSLQSEIDSVRDHYDSSDNFNQMLRGSNLELRELNTKLKIVEEEKDNTKRNLMKCEEANKILKKELKEIKTNYEKLQVYYEEIKSNMNYSFHKISSKENEIINMKSQVIMRDKIIVNLKKRLKIRSHSEIKNNKFKEMLSNLNKDLKEKESTWNLKANMERERDLLHEEMKNQINWMKNQLGKYEESEKYLNNEIKRLLNENDSLKTKLKINQMDTRIESTGSPIKALSVDRINSSVERNDKIDNIIITIVHSFSEVFLKIYSLFEKNLNKWTNKNLEYYYQNLSKIMSK